MKDRVCIIAVGYNRPDAMSRLLTSLNNADYLGDEVDLLISIDKGPRQSEIVKLCESFEWKYGEKNIRAFSERQGLRSHIIQCGDYSKDYSGVVVLEDDLTVNRNYYNYVRSCISFYSEDERIAGISLYKHCFNIDAGSFFEPVFDGNDVYLMQYAQSWGQCWTPRMWNGFREWYAKNEKIFDDTGSARLFNFPENITKWSNQSWLKYYIAYVIENDLYYVYPHVSVTTNHSEVGEHNQIPNGDYQVATPQGVFDYRLKSSDGLIRYDAFFERMDLVIPEFIGKKVIIDLYGRKRYFDNADILISTAARPFRVIESWKLKLRPQEQNCLEHENGAGIYVYDLHNNEAAPKPVNCNLRTRYDVRAIHYRKLLYLGITEVNLSIRNKFKKLLKK